MGQSIQSSDRRGRGTLFLPGHHQADDSNIRKGLTISSDRRSWNRNTLQLHTHSKTVLQRPSKDLNSECGGNHTGHREQDDATLEDHRASRDGLGGIIKAAQTIPTVTPYSPIHVLCLAIIDTCNAFTVRQGA